MRKTPQISGARLAAALVALVAAVSCTSTGTPPPSQAGPIVIPLKPYVSLLRTVDVTIDGKTLPFLFDTGGGATFVTPDVASEIGCKPFGRLTGFRNNGERIDASRCGASDISVGSFHTRANDLSVFDLMSLLQGLPELGGLIGLQAFEGRLMTIDLAAERVVIETPESFATRIRTMMEIRIRPSREAGGADLDVFVSVDTPRGPIWLELDSGNLAAVLLSPPALEQLGVELPDKEPRKITLEVSGFGPVEVDAVARDTIYDGLLDARFMRRMVITLDLARMRAWMAPHRDAS